MTKEILQQALDALTRLSFLGNGDFPGNSEGNRIAQKAVADIKQALSQQEQPSKTERQIRRMFCVTYASDSSPYMDDGEAQDNSRHPCIDFLRDSPEQIQSKMVERAIAKHKAQQEQPVLSDEQIAEIAKPFISSMGDHWCHEDGIRDNGAIEEFARAVIEAHCRGGAVK